MKLLLIVVKYSENLENVMLCFGGAYTAAIVKWLLFNFILIAQDCMKSWEKLGRSCKAMVDLI